MGLIFEIDVVYHKGSNLSWIHCFEYSLTAYVPELQWSGFAHMILANVRAMCYERTLASKNSQDAVKLFFLHWSYHTRLAKFFIWLNMFTITLLYHRFHKGRAWHITCSMSLMMSPGNLEMDTWPHCHKLTDQIKK